jgi:hypothetical protein
MHNPQEDNIQIPLTDMEWFKVEHTMFSIMHNGSGELFVRYNNCELRLTPISDKQFHISDWNTNGKFRLSKGIDVVEL